MDAYHHYDICGMFGAPVSFQEFRPCPSLYHYHCGAIVSASSVVQTIRFGCYDNGLPREALKNGASIHKHSHCDLKRWVTNFLQYV